MDNTASPVICKPIEHRPAVVIHSLTKYIGGHGTAVAGSIVDSGNFDWTADPKRQPLFNEPDNSYGGVIWGKAVPELTGANVPFAVRARVCLLRDLGSALAPDNAFAIIQGLETVALRMRQHCANAEPKSLSKQTLALTAKGTFAPVSSGTAFPQTTPP